MISDAMQALVRMLAIEFTLEGYTFSVLELLIYFAFGSILAYIIGRLLE